MLLLLKVTPSGGNSEDLSSSLHSLDPDSVEGKQYHLFLRCDTKSCLPSVSRCQQCRTVFGSADIAVVKTSGERERYGNKGEVMKYHGNIHQNFLTKCLKQHDSNFAFGEIAVTKNPQDSLHDSVKLMLEAKGVTFAR